MTHRITNADRATWAETALLEYAIGKEGGEELYDETSIVLTDMLTDLMHYAAREGIDFTRSLDQATGHYGQEGIPSSIG